MSVEISKGHNPLRDPDDRRLSRIAGPSALVIFGVTGDLSRKKLMPAVYDLANRGLLPPGFALVGFARRDWEDQDFAQVVYEAVKQHARTEFREETWQQLLQGIRFVSGEFDDPEAFARLRETVDKLDVERGTMGNHAYYLSIPPKAFPLVTQQLKDSGLVGDAAPDGNGWRRVVIEKPFGHDLASARELNNELESAFPADAIFRIDHYLGKETVQNILALRFANELYEPIWNRNYVDHVQITMAEDIGVGGRAGYYDGIGAARDVIQNHLLQLMALTAMEEPISFDATMTEELGQNALVIRVQPDEGITLRFGSKVPGNAMEVRDVSMDFSYGSAFAEESPEAYERLILDVLLGEPSLFPVNAEVELAWKILDPALEYWASHGKPDPYESGGWGPDSAFEMMNRTGRAWRRP